MKETEEEKKKKEKEKEEIKKIIGNKYKEGDLKKANLEVIWI